eukprot:RCo036887
MGDGRGPRRSERVSRGGRTEFDWEPLKLDKRAAQEEYYLGRSQMCEDLWYSKAKPSRIPTATDAPGDDVRRAELAALQRAEQELMKAALGVRRTTTRPARPSGGGPTPPSAHSSALENLSEVEIAALLGKPLPVPTQTAPSQAEPGQGEAKDEQEAEKKPHSHRHKEKGKKEKAKKARKSKSRSKSRSRSRGRHSKKKKEKAKKARKSKSRSKSRSRSRGRHSKKK